MHGWKCKSTLVLFQRFVMFFSINKRTIQRPSDRKKNVFPKNQEFPSTLVWHASTTLPGISGYFGRPPVAMINLSDVTVFSFPFLFTHLIVIIFSTSSLNANGLIPKTHAFFECTYLYNIADLFFKHSKISHLPESMGVSKLCVLVHIGHRLLAQGNPARS